MLGILMLDTAFPRPLGDVGHPGSWRMPVRRVVVPGAFPARVVEQGDDTLLEPFVRAAQDLVEQGARAITTSCGFLVRWQVALQQALPVPVWSSALLALPGLPDAGVLTVDARRLGSRELLAAGASPHTPVQGLANGCVLQATLLYNRACLDEEQARADTVAAARELVRRHPAIRHIVLECTNLPPYADAVALATGRPVHHLMTLVHERWETLR
jgi:hypothetical protein